MYCKKTPVAVIGFARADLIRRTLSALADADSVLDRDVFVYLAPPRNETEKSRTDKVYEVVKEFQEGKLANIQIVKRLENQGASLNIRYGIEKTLEKAGRAIIIEDDVLISRTALTYFDSALEFYERDNRVWCINGYNNCLLKVPRKYPFDVLVNLRNMAWGWAIWKDRWDKTNFDMSDWPEYRANPSNLDALTRAGSEMVAMLDCVFNDGANAWDAQCSYHMVRNSLYAIEPRYSLTKNIGFASVGAVHKGRVNGIFEKQKFYNFMPKFVNVDDILEYENSWMDRFCHAASDHRPIHFAWRCVMRVLKHYFGSCNNDPKELCE